MIELLENCHLFKQPSSHMRVYIPNYNHDKMVPQKCQNAKQLSQKNPRRSTEEDTRRYEEHLPIKPLESTS